MTVRPLNTVLQGLRQLLGADECADSDGHLLDRFVKGRDESAFTALMSRHGTMVWAVCRRVLRHEQDAEDAFQATFLVLARRACDLDRRNSVAGWLHTVAYHTALRARGISAKRQLCERPLEQEPLSSRPTRENDLHPILEEELHRLPTRYRVPLVLCYLEGKTNEEAARELRCPIGTVKGRLSRARDMLRARLNRRGIAMSVGTLGGCLVDTAAVPAELMTDTGRVALLCLAGEQSLHCSASPTVSTLATGVLKTMVLAKIKVRALCLAVLAILCFGLGTYGYFALSNANKPTPKAEGEEQRESESKEILLRVLASYNTPVGSEGPAFDGPRVILTRPNIDGKTKKGGLRQPVAQPPAADAETTAVLIGPVLNSGEAWRPTQVLRDGNHTTIIVESWRDNAPRKRNVPFEPTHIISLGKLRAGKHTLHVRIDQFQLDVGRPDVAAVKHYRLIGGLQGKLEFSVADKAPPATGRVPTLTKQDLSVQKPLTNFPPRQRVDDPWQAYPGGEPMPVVHRLKPPQGENGTVALGPRAGTADLKQHWPKPPSDLKDLPPLNPQVKFREPVYVSVLGPTLNTGEHMTLSSVQWNGRKVTLYVDLWRDNAGRNRNARRSPLLFIPLHEGLGNTLSNPGEFEVEVVWSLLYSPDLNEALHSLYTRYNAKSIAEAPVEPTIKKSFLALAKSASNAKFKISAPSDPTTTRQTQLKRDPSSFALTLNHFPPDNPTGEFYLQVVQQSPPPQSGAQTSHYLKREEVLRLIDRLAQEGILRQGQVGEAELGKDVPWVLRIANKQFVQHQVFLDGNKASATRKRLLELLGEVTDDKVIRTWKAAGARVGWMRVHRSGVLHFSTTKEETPGQIPGFQMDKWRDGVLSELPDLGVPFGLDLLRNEVTDTGLKELAGLKSLQMLNLGVTPVTDAGLKELAKLESWQALYLGSTPVTHAGLKELAGLKNLRSLNLFKTPVTDAGMKELAELKNLQTLNLFNTKVTDAGLKDLARLKSLQSLDLGDTQVTDAGLRDLARMMSLQSLTLSSTPVTDAGMKELAELKNLQVLSLFRTKVTDMGLKELAGLKNLQELNLGATPVTDAGLKELTGLKDLQVLSLFNTKVTGASLDELARLKDLHTLSLWNAPVTDEGLKKLAGLKNLQSLYISGTPVTDAGLKELAGLKSLRSLNLYNTRVTNVGIKELAGLKNLEVLNLQSTQVTNAGVAELHKALPDCRISR